MEPLGKPELLAYIQRQRLAVIATTAEDGSPQAALVGVAVTAGLEVVFDTLSTTRKHANLQRDRRVAVTFSGPGEQTLQYEGEALPVSVESPSDKGYREVYYASWPDGRQRTQSPNLVYWRIVPRWVRYSEYANGPCVVEFHW